MTSPADIDIEASRNEPRCTKCGAGPHPTLPGRCAGADGPTHFMRGNTASAITGAHGAHFRREHGAEIDAKADHFARDAGYASLKAAPLGFQIASVALARTATIGDLAYWKMLEAGGPLSESGKPRRAYAIWADVNRDLARDLKGAMSEVVAARPPGDEQRNEFAAMSTQALFDAAVGMAEELAALLAAEAPVAVPDDQTVAALPTRATRPASEPALSRESAATSTAPATVRLSFSSGANLPPTPDSRVSPPPARREEPAAPDPDAEPVVHAYAGRRVTAADVRHCMRDTGDEDAYLSGRISQQDAYERTRRFIRAAREQR